MVVVGVGIGFWLRCGRQGEALRKATLPVSKRASILLLMLCSGLALPADTACRWWGSGPALPGCCRVLVEGYVGTCALSVILRVAQRSRRIHVCQLLGPATSYRVTALFS